MKKVGKLFFIPLACCVLGMTSCLENGGNQTTVPFTPAVVEPWSFDKGTSISSPYGVFATPELEGKVNDSECILAGFTVDYDNQPSDKYVTATNVSYEKVPKGYVDIVAGAMVDDYVDSIMTAVPMSHPTLKGNIFFELKLKASANQEYGYELLCNEDSVDTHSNKTMFLKAVKTNTSTGTIGELYDYCAFDANDFINRMGKDTTITGIKLRYVTMSLKYQTGMKNGVPVYTQYADSVSIAKYR